MPPEAKMPPYNAGHRKLRIPQPGRGARLPVSLWYPTNAPETSRREGLFSLSAAFDAEPAEGGFGLIAVSHGSGGSDVNHHDWAEALARAGYVVVAPRHVGDSHDANAGIGSREQLLQRPRQLRAALAAAREDPRLGARIDPGRIGVMGFSAGGYTALTVMGARPDFSRWNAYCRRSDRAPLICPLDRAPSVPKTDTGDWEGVSEPELRAAVLFAPFAMLFGQEALANISIPIRLYRATDDSVTKNGDNADAVATQVSGTTEVVDVPGGHYVFIAPVDETTAAKYPEFYMDEPGIHRRNIHRTIAGEVVNFFDMNL